VGALEGLKAMAMKPSPLTASPAMEAGDDESADPKMAAVTPAAQDLIAAIKMGDAQGVARALLDAYEGCMGGGAAESAPEGTE
jgi:hypothetical protein